MEREEKKGWGEEGYLYENRVAKLGRGTEQPSPLLAVVGQGLGNKPQWFKVQVPPGRQGEIENVPDRHRVYPITRLISHMI